MRIHTFDDPILRRKAAPVKRVNAAVRNLARAMVETMRENRGLGLAAPQVGSLTRIVVSEVDDELRILVNPRVTASAGSELEWEGCLSFPGLAGEIERAAKVSVAALDLEARPVWVDAEGLLARVLQHEIDHLDGVVILDRARSLKPILPEAGGQAVPPEAGGQAVSPEAEGQAVPVEAGGAAGLAEAGGQAAPPGAGGRPGAVEAAGRPGGRPKGGDVVAGRSPAAPRRRLRVAFMGTPDFAVPALEAIVESGHEVVGVVTRSDHMAGRGGKVARPSAVKEAAERLGLVVWQGSPGEARAELASVLAAWEAEVGVVAAFGLILPPAVLTVPRLGCINLHASLLPRYRGAAPIQRALMDGCRVTGVTVIRMDEGVDTGDILAQREVEVGPEDTAGTLHDRLAAAGAELVVHCLGLLAEGRVCPRPQPVEGSSLAPRLGPGDEVIAWEHPAEAIARQVRALNPAPGAYTVFGGRRVKVWRAEAEPVERRGGRASPGVVVAVRDGFPIVATGRGNLTLRQLQPAGAAKMTGQEFVRGYRLKIGDRLGG